MNLDLLINSIALTGATVIIAGFLGVAGALALAASSERGRAWLLGAAVLVLMLPPFWVAGEWMRVLGFAGAWRAGAGPWTDRGMPIVASAGVLGSLLWPLTAIWIDAAWRRIDPRLAEAWPELRGTRWVRTVMVPVAGASMTAPLAITAVFAWAQFSVPAVFQARVWPAEMWLQLATRLDAAAALKVAIGPALLLAVAVGLGAHRIWRFAEPEVGPREAVAMTARLGTAWCRLGVVLGVLLLATTLAAPVAAAAGDSRVWAEIPRVLGPHGATLVKSGLYAALSATVVMGLGIGLAESRAGRWLLGVSVLVWVLPGMGVGMVAARVATWPGLGWTQGSLALVVGAFAVRYLAVGGVVAQRARARGIADDEAALRVFGARPWQAWRWARWPRHAARYAAAWYLVYLLSLWDVETLLLVVPPGGESVALVIFNLLHYGHTAQVSALGLWLALLAIAPLLLAGLIRGFCRWRAGVSLFALSAAGWATVGCGASSDPSPRADLRSQKLDSQLFERVEVIGAKGTGPGFFNKPRSLTVDREDELYVVDMTGRVQKFDRSARWLLLWQMPETDKGRAKGMAGLEDGSVLVVEPHYHRVNRYSPVGQLLGQWGAHGTNAGQLWFPRAVAVGASGDCFVSEYGVIERVQRFRVDDGVYLGGFGDAGLEPGRFNRAEGVGCDRSGRVYVADSCNHRVQVFDAEGRLLRSHGRAGKGLGEFGYPYDVQVDREGNQFVCEFGNSRVQVLDAGDRPLEILGGLGQGPDRMNSPWSLCLDSRGNLYVADSQNHRVLKFVRRRPIAVSARGAVGMPEMQVEALN